MLGSMLLSQDAVIVATEQLQPEDFYMESHRRIFDVISRLYENREPIDLITVTEALRSNKILEQVGGAVYLTTLTETVPTASNIALLQNCRGKGDFKAPDKYFQVYCQWPMIPNIRLKSFG